MDGVAESAAISCARCLAKAAPLDRLRAISSVYPVFRLGRHLCGSEGRRPMAHDTGGTGIGARLRRKEDARFLAGKGNYVSDIQMPGLKDVAFLRSPLAHARIHGVTKPKGTESDVFVAADLVGVKPMHALS